MMQITLYGIPNCDTVKKARTWLSTRQHDVVFHDLKKAGIDHTTITTWLQHVQWDVLVNRKGTTWRGLTDARKAEVVDTDSAIALMLELPSIIKRPVLVHPSQIVVGFSESIYESLFKK